MLRGAHRVRDRGQLLRIERATKARAAQRVADIPGAAKARRRARPYERARRLGLVLQSLRLAQIAGRMQRERELAPGHEPGPIGEQRSDRGVFKTRERALVHGRETPGEPRTRKRQGFSVVAC